MARRGKGGWDVHSVEEIRPRTRFRSRHSQIPPLEPHAEVEFVRVSASSAEDKQAKGMDSSSQQDEYSGPNFQRLDIKF
jgi:hypothetical protein